MTFSVHFASYYRWLVASRYWGLPREFPAPVLDVGANDGYFLSRIQAPLKIGVDLVALKPKPQRLVVADAQRLPFVDETLSNIFAFDIIEHVVDDYNLLRDIVRVLHPGGTLWLSTTARGFRVFPGGSVQRRLERSWGHVRVGYSKENLLSCLPDNTRAQFFFWNEPFFRFLYLPLKLVFGFSPELTLWFLRRLITVDARYSEGEYGHIYAKIVKNV